jgi:hypothetical protein
VRAREETAEAVVVKRAGESRRERRAEEPRNRLTDKLDGLKPRSDPKQNRSGNIRQLPELAVGGEVTLELAPKRTAESKASDIGKRR